jgi:hypothetical protein
MRDELDVRIRVLGGLSDEKIRYSSGMEVEHIRIEQQKTGMFQLYRCLEKLLCNNG